MTQLVKILTTGFMVLGLVALSGCNTVQGVGKDVQAGGRAVQKAAQ